ncbi:hypothetical protein [Methanonatronarchaeum sp. AMET6-2]|uniref:hypothetical protein n=1 Tax=Methanonatronarchaeum sp. AMET6-2 TaxID=2933293 RepID=UPI001200C9A9|nr:hypothetical protein [Methanonatronarchaeum sp. AMET6-2]RZN62252.1 MAG: hypothetical protein EF811_03350 [Methanonatronarchaeia archaeon]UOY10412.1 hypothetical protein MU439_01915 [Methanonatronarchaeum sp. AMET6-2]
MKLVKQVSVFLKNQPGELARLFKEIDDGGIDVSAFEIAEAGDFGVIRLITPEPERLKQKLGASDYTVSEVRVISINSGDVSRASAILGRSDINIEYAYSACHIDGENRVIMKVDDPEAGLNAIKK